MCFPFPRYVRTDGLCPSLHSSSLLSQQVSSCLPFFFSCSFQDWPLTLNKIGEGPQRRRLFCSCIVAHLHIYHGRPDLFAVYFYYSPPSWLWVIRRKGNREVNWYMDHLERVGLLRPWIWPFAFPRRREAVGGGGSANQRRTIHHE